jgi:hydantoinase/carbamoylase family amidase
LHIEQGRVLEEAGRAIGVVEAIAAPCRLRLRLTGRADHSGATPMPLRRDALAGAAEVVLAIEGLAAASNGVVGTVGTLRVEPGAINVVPGQVELGIDIRAMTRAARDPVVAAIRAAIDGIAAARQLEATIEILSDEEPVTLDRDLAALLARCAHARDLDPLHMPSGAGHDAMHLARLCPSGMLFIPSRDGISHNRLEWSDLDHIVAGTQVLCDAALELAGRGTG